MLDQIKHQAEHFVKENASALLTAGGVVGTVGTAVLTGRAAFKAKELIDSEYEVVLGGPDEVRTKDKVMATWHLFLPPVGAGALTIGAIIGANHVSSKRAAALALAYGASERRFEEYKDKALEKLGVNKEEKLRDEVAQDRVNNNPEGQVIIAGDGEVLCFDPVTGRYWRCTVEKLTRAMAQVHSEIYKYNHCSLTHFYDEVGLDQTDVGDLLGWNDKDIPDIHWTAVVTKDERPCLSIDFSPMPQPDYAAMY